MDLMTASPGVLYKVDGVFRNGPVKGKILPGFNLDSRKPLAENLKSTTAAIYSPKLATKVQLVQDIAVFDVLLGSVGAQDSALRIRRICATSGLVKNCPDPSAWAIAALGDAVFYWSTPFEHQGLSRFSIYLAASFSI